MNLLCESTVETGLTLGTGGSKHLLLCSREAGCRIVLGKTTG